MPGRRLGQKMLCVTHHTAAETHQHQEELKIHDFILFKWPVNTCSHLETCVLHNDSSLFPEVKALRTSHWPNTTKRSDIRRKHKRIKDFLLALCTWFLVVTCCWTNILLVLLPGLFFLLFTQRAQTHGEILALHSNACQALLACLPHKMGAKIWDDGWHSDGEKKNIRRHRTQTQTDTKPSEQQGAIKTFFFQRFNNSIILFISLTFCISPSMILLKIDIVGEYCIM